MVWLFSGEKTFDDVLNYFW